jgi:hypothetical protein
LNQLRYADIERQIVEALPEIRAAAEFYWKTEGDPGQDSGPYIFFEQLFATYVEVLLWLPVGPRRDELLSRAFDLVEQMLGSMDRDVQNLAAIGFYEDRDPAWLKRARAFVGSHGRAYLNGYHPLWPECIAANDQIPPEILDGYHVRAVIARELSLHMKEVPGTTYAADRLEA